MVGFLDQNSDKRDSGLRLNPNIKQIQIPNEQTYKTILNDMVLAFHKNRTKCDTLANTEKYCRAILNTCLTSFNPDGTLWKKAPGKNTQDWYETLMLRLRVYKYDIATKSLIGKKINKIQEKMDEVSPPSSSPMRNAGGDPYARSFAASEEALYKEFIQKFTQDFTTAVTVVDEMMIERLAFLMILSKRDINNVEPTEDLTKEIKDLAESMGVSGKQRIMQVSGDKSGTLEQLTMKYKKTLEEYIAIEVEWKMEELKCMSNAIRRGTLPEFLASSWTKILYGKFMTADDINSFLRENKIID